MPWIRRLVAGLLQPRYGFNRRPVRVGFAVGRVALGQCFLREISFYQFSILIHSSITDVMLYQQLTASLTLRLLMSYIYIYIYIYIYGAPILDVSRSHTTTQHSR